MELIDSNLGWKAIEQRIQRTTNDRHLGMLKVLRRHMEAEMIGDLEGMLAGLVAKPKYHMWGSGADTGPKDYDSIRQYYVDLLAVRRGVLEYAIERIVIDDDSVVTEGTIRAFQPGAVAKAFGYRVDELNATYLVTYRALIIWPFDLAGDLIGEDGYGSINPNNFVKVDGKNLPNTYVSLFDKSEYASIGL